MTDTLTIVTNALAYYGIRTLRIRNVFIVEAQGIKKSNGWSAIENIDATQIGIRELFNKTF